MNEKKVAYKVNNEIELSENLFKDFKFNDNKNQKNIEQLNKYGDEILSSTKKEILKLKNEI